MKRIDALGQLSNSEYSRYKQNHFNRAKIDIFLHMLSQQNEQDANSFKLLYDTFPLLWRMKPGPYSNSPKFGLNFMMFDISKKQFIEGLMIVYILSPQAINKFSIKNLYRNPSLYRRTYKIPPSSMCTGQKKEEEEEKNKEKEEEDTKNWIMKGKVRRQYEIDWENSYQEHMAMRLKEEKETKRLIEKTQPLKPLKEMSTQERIRELRSNGIIVSKRDKKSVYRLIYNYRKKNNLL